jgi:hypothetical protein
VARASTRSRAGPRFMVVQPGEGPPRKKAPSAYATGQGCLCTRQQRKSGRGVIRHCRKVKAKRGSVFQPTLRMAGLPITVRSLVQCAEKPPSVETQGGSDARGAEGCFMVRAAARRLAVGVAKVRFPARPTTAACRGRGEDRQGLLFPIIAGIRAQGRLSQLSAIS